MDDTLQTVVSVHGHTIRVTTAQWAHISESHDYMAGNLDKVIETIAEPTQIIAGQRGESCAMRNDDRTNITRKTAIVIYRDEPDGFVNTAFLTSSPERIQRKGLKIWPR